LNSSVTGLGKPAWRQYSKARHEALAEVGPRLLATPNGTGYDYFGAYDLQWEWLREAGLIELLPETRPGGARRVVRTDEGERVLTLWNER
jgi:hypothetical protein